MISPRLPLLVLCVFSLAACSREHGASTTTPPASTASVKPQSATGTPAAPPTPAAPTAPASPAKAESPAPVAATPPVDGEPIVRGICMACHQAGMNGAPKFGDKIAWKPRIAQGRAVLYEHATKGLRGMPPRGGNPNLNDDQVKAAVDYMVKASGGYPN